MNLYVIWETCFHDARGTYNIFPKDLPPTKKNVTSPPPLPLYLLHTLPIGKIWIFLPKWKIFTPILFPTSRTMQNNRHQTPDNRQRTTDKITDNRKRTTDERRQTKRPTNQQTTDTYIFFPTSRIMQNNRQQTTDNRQQTTDNRQSTASWW